MPVHPRLTETILKRVAVPEGREETHWDGEMRGLGVRVRCFGGRLSRTWIIKYRNATGAQRKLTLGDWPGLAVGAARRLAKKEIGRIADKADPVREKAQTREAGTVALLLARFLKDHVKGKKRSETTAKEYGRLVEKVIKPALGSAQVAAIERTDVERWFTALSSTPRQANQALAVLSKAMSLAEAWKLRPAFSNPCKGIERYPEVQRDRYPSQEEYEAIGKALEALERSGTISKANANVVRLLALTGLRLSEVRCLRWRNVDTKRGILTLDMVKNGRVESRTRVIGTASLAVLAAQPCNGDEEYVFPGSATQEPVSLWTVEDTWKRIRKKSGVANLRLHDLRHGVGTLAATLGANAFLVRDKLGHATLHMTSRYVGKQTDPLTQITEKIESRVVAAMGQTAPENLKDVAVGQ